MKSVTEAPAGIVELPDATPLLADPDALAQRWREDGALFFKGAISRTAIEAVRSEYLARLKDMSVVDANETEPRWNGRARLDGALARPIPDTVWRTLVRDSKLDRVIRTFLGEAPVWLPIVVHRTAPPLAPSVDAATFGARHQDGIYNYGINFITCWVPLMDIDEDVGGLAVVPGSHKASLYPPDVFTTPGQRVGIPEDAIPDAAWRRPAYRVGDLLMFHSMTAHAGLPNRSDCFRLSMDIRFLPASAAPFVGRVAAAGEQVLEMRSEAGEPARFAIDAETIVRGPKGHPVHGPEREGVLFPDAEVIVMPDHRGNARLIRSVSRKFIDLPAPWYDSFPAGWVK